MDKDKELKTYEENGVKYQFSPEQLNYYIDLRRSQMAIPGQKPASKRKVMMDMAGKMNISADTVKSWSTGINGPMDLKLVGTVAEYFEIEYHELLVKKEEDKDMSENMIMNEMLDEKQKAATRERIREIYEATIEATDKVWKYFLTEFYTYDNIEDMAQRYHTEFEEAEDSCDKVSLLLRKYKLDIPEEKYKELCRFLNMEAEFVLMNASCAFTGNDDEDEVQARSDLWDEYEEYRNSIKFDEKVRSVFGEYMVK